MDNQQVTSNRSSHFGSVPPLASRPKSQPLLQIPTHLQDTSSAALFDTRYANDSLVVGNETKPYGTLLGHSSSSFELADIAPPGAEYSTTELAEMTRSHRRKVWRQKQARTFDHWLHGQHLMCGWLGRGTALMILFVFLIMLILILYFVIPRVPSKYEARKNISGNGNGAGGHTWKERILTLAKQLFISSRVTHLHLLRKSLIWFFLVCLQASSTFFFLFLSFDKPLTHGQNEWHYECASRQQRWMGSFTLAFTSHRCHTQLHKCEDWLG